MRVHLQESERLASLLGVLAGRLARTDKMLERAREGGQAVSLILLGLPVNYCSPGRTQKSVGKLTK